MTAEAALDPLALRAAYDARLRARDGDPLPAGASAQRDGPLLRFVGLDGRGLVTYRDLGGLAGAELDALIARQRDLFAARGEPVEWKLHGHDAPPDLPERLRAAGFDPGDPETVMVGAVAGLAAMQPVVPEGVRLREVTARADLDRVAAFRAGIAGADRDRLADGLAHERAVDPQRVTVVAAEADDAVICAGFVRYVAGTPFATLWGGSTAPRWRRRGVYRALVVYRARLASVRGCTYLQVDASDESRPILERLGFVAVTTTTPYVFRPPVGRTDENDGMAATLTDDEKQTLKTAAFGAVFLVSNADPGFFSMVRESFAASGVLTGGSGLVKEVMTTGGLPRLPKNSAELVEAAVLPALRRSVEILAAKAPAELESYRTTVLAAADRVAATSEGVSTREAEMLAKVRDALGVPV